MISCADCKFEYPFVELFLSVDSNPLYDRDKKVYFRLGQVVGLDRLIFCLYDETSPRELEPPAEAEFQSCRSPIP